MVLSVLELGVNLNNQTGMFSVWVLIILLKFLTEGINIPSRSTKQIIYGKGLNEY